MRFLILISAHQGVWSFKCFITTLCCCGCLNDGAREGAFLVRLSLYLGLDALLSCLIISLLFQGLGTWFRKSKGAPQPPSHVGRGREAQGQEKDLSPLHSPASKRLQGQLGQFCAPAHTPPSVNQLQLVDVGKAEVIPVISWPQSCHLASCLCAGVPCNIHSSHQNRSLFTLIPHC